MSAIAVKLYTSTEAAELAGITDRQLDHWVRIGQVLAPVSTPWSGSGIHRRWTGDEVRILAILGVLSAAHAPLAVMAIAASALGEAGTIRKGDGRWLVCSNEWAQVVNSRDLSKTVAKGALWFIPLVHGGAVDL